MSLIEDWAADSDDLEYNDRDEVVDQYGRVVVTVNNRRDNERVVVYKDGGMALQGEALEARSNDGPPILIVEGTRHAWDQGPVEFEGQFAVFGDRHLDIDGPIPEASQA